MKRIVFLLLAVLGMHTLMAQNILPKPNPPRLVNDAAGVLSPEQRDILEQKLVALDDSSSNQIAVVLVKTLSDYPIEDYAVKLFRDWGIGNKKTNNGVLLIAAIDDHKVRIEVGYGLEGAIPDIVSASIIRNDIAPNFRDGNYYRGIDQATNSIAKAAVGEYKVKRERQNSSGTSAKSIFTFIIILIVVLVILGRGGGGGGGMVSRRGYGDIAQTIFWSSLLSGGGSDGGGEGPASWSSRRRPRPGPCCAVMCSGPQNATGRRRRLTTPAGGVSSRTSGTGRRAGAASGVRRRSRRRSARPGRAGRARPRRRPRPRTAPRGCRSSPACSSPGRRCGPRPVHPRRSRTRPAHG